jgi:hypothetical protein
MITSATTSTSQTPISASAPNPSQRLHLLPIHQKLLGLTSGNTVGQFIALAYLTCLSSECPLWSIPHSLSLSLIYALQPSLSFLTHPRRASSSQEGNAFFSGELAQVDGNHPHSFIFYPTDHRAQWGELAVLTRPRFLP